MLLEIKKDPVFGYKQTAAERIRKDPLNIMYNWMFVLLKIFSDSQSCSRSTLKKLKWLWSVSWAILDPQTPALLDNKSHKGRNYSEHWRPLIKLQCNQGEVSSGLKLPAQSKLVLFFPAFKFLLDFCHLCKSFLISTWRLHLYKNHHEWRPLMCWKSGKKM